MRNRVEQHGLIGPGGATALGTLTVVLALSALFADVARSQKPRSPLTKREVEDGLLQGTSSDKMADNVRTRGIGFVLTETHLEILRGLGAGNNLVVALCEASPRPLTIDQVRAKLKRKATAAQLSGEISRVGVDFDLTEDAARALKLAGATPRLIKAVHSARRTPPEGCQQTLNSEAQKREEFPPAVAPLSPGEPDVTPPIPIYKPEPPYPKGARNLALEGTVSLLVEVDSEGNVTEAKIVKHFEESLDRSALETVRQWRFQPAKRNGIPVSVKIIVEVQFHYAKKPN